ncbi:MAG: DMT family transporter [Marinobacterium sp.]|nr:DMT family transporter [Marinobacterium sp.]
MDLSSSHRKGLLLVLISAIAYGCQPLFASQAYSNGVNPAGLLLSRFLLASLMLWSWLYWRKTPLPTLRQLGPALLTGAGYGGAALGYYNAIHSSSVSLAVVLMFSFPAFVVVLSALLLKTPLTRTRLVALALALGGVVLASGHDMQGDITGISWALFAALSYGSAILYGSHKLPARGSLSSAAVIMLGCIIPFLMALPWHPPQWPSNSEGWQAVAALALFCTIVPIATFIAGAAITGAGDAATLSTLEPVVAVILAVTLLGEPLHNATLAGGLMVVLAALMLAGKPATATTHNSTA